MLIVTLLMVIIFIGFFSVWRVGYSIILGRSPAAIEVPRPRALTAIESQCATGLIRHAIATQLKRTLQRRSGQLLWNSIIHEVHYTTGSARAKQQGRRPAQDFDLFDQQRIYGHRVVIAGAGGITQGQPIIQKSHAAATQTPNNGSASTRSVIRGSHTRLAR